MSREDTDVRSRTSLRETVRRIFARIRSNREETDKPEPEEVNHYSTRFLPEEEETTRCTGCWPWLKRKSKGLFNRRRGRVDPSFYTDNNNIRDGMLFTIYKGELPRNEYIPSDFTDFIGAPTCFTRETNIRSPPSSCESEDSELSIDTRGAGRRSQVRDTEGRCPKARNDQRQKKASVKSTKENAGTTKGTKSGSPPSFTATDAAKSETTNKPADIKVTHRRSAKRTHAIRTNTVSRSPAAKQSSGSWKKSAVKQVQITEEQHNSAVETPMVKGTSEDKQLKSSEKLSGRVTREKLAEAKPKKVQLTTADKPKVVRGTAAVKSCKKTKVVQVASTDKTSNFSENKPKVHQLTTAADKPKLVQVAAAEKSSSKPKVHVIQVASADNESKLEENKPKVQPLTTAAKPQVAATAKSSSKPKVIQVASADNQSRKEENKPKVEQLTTADKPKVVQVAATAKSSSKPKVIQVASADNQSNLEENKPKVQQLTAAAKPQVAATAKSSSKPKVIQVASADNQSELEENKPKVGQLTTSEKSPIKPKVVQIARVPNPFNFAENKPDVVRVTTDDKPSNVSQTQPKLAQIASSEVKPSHKPKVVQVSSAYKPKVVQVSSAYNPSNFPKVVQVRNSDKSPHLAEVKTTVQSASEIQFSIEAEITPKVSSGVKSLNLAETEPRLIQIKSAQTSSTFVETEPKAEQVTSEEKPCTFVKNKVVHWQITSAEKSSNLAEIELKGGHVTSADIPSSGTAEVSKAAQITRAEKPASSVETPKPKVAFVKSTDKSSNTAEIKSKEQVTAVEDAANLEEVTIADKSPRVFDVVMKSTGIQAVQAKTVERPATLTHPMSKEDTIKFKAENLSQIADTTCTANQETDQKETVIYPSENQSTSSPKAEEAMCTDAISEPDNPSYFTERLTFEDKHVKLENTVSNNTTDDQESLTKPTVIQVHEAISAPEPLRPANSQLPISTTNVSSHGNTSNTNAGQVSSGNDSSHGRSIRHNILSRAMSPLTLDEDVSDASTTEQRLLGRRGSQVSSGNDDSIHSKATRRRLHYRTRSPMSQDESTDINTLFRRRPLLPRRESPVSSIPQYLRSMSPSSDSFMSSDSDQDSPSNGWGHRDSHKFRRASAFTGVFPSNTPRRVRMAQVSRSASPVDGPRRPAAAWESGRPQTPTNMEISRCESPADHDLLRGSGVHEPSNDLPRSNVPSPYSKGAARDTSCSPEFTHNRRTPPTNEYRRMNCGALQRNRYQSPLARVTRSNSPVTPPDTTISPVLNVMRTNSPVPSAASPNHVSKFVYPVSTPNNVSTANQRFPLATNNACNFRAVSQVNTTSRANALLQKVNKIMSAVATRVSEQQQEEKAKGTSAFPLKHHADGTAKTEQCANTRADQMKRAKTIVDQNRVSPVRVSSTPANSLSAFKKTTPGFENVKTSAINLKKTHIKSPAEKVVPQVDRVASSNSRRTPVKTQVRDMRTAKSTVNIRSVQDEPEEIRKTKSIVNEGDTQVQVVDITSSHGAEPKNEESSVLKSGDRKPNPAATKTSPMKVKVESLVTERRTAEADKTQFKCAVSAKKTPLLGAVQCPGTAARRDATTQADKAKRKCEVSAASNSRHQQLYPTVTKTSMMGARVKTTLSERRDTAADNAAITKYAVAKDNSRDELMVVDVESPAPRRDTNAAVAKTQMIKCAVAADKGKNEQNCTTATETSKKGAKSPYNRIKDNTTENAKDKTFGAVTKDNNDSSSTLQDQFKTKKKKKRGNIGKIQDGPPEVKPVNDNVRPAETRGSDDQARSKSSANNAKANEVAIKESRRENDTKAPGRTENDKKEKPRSKHSPDFEAVEYDPPLQNDHNLPSLSKSHPNPPPIQVLTDKDRQRVSEILSKHVSKELMDVSWSSASICGSDLKFATYTDSEQNIKVGSGAFGQVFLALLYGSMPVVVKIFDRKYSKYKDVTMETQLMNHLSSVDCSPMFMGVCLLPPNDNFLRVGVVQEFISEPMLRMTRSRLVETIDMDKWRMSVGQTCLMEWKSLPYRLAKSLSAIHDRGVLLNDIKTDNILLQYDKSRGHWQPFYIDLGVSCPTKNDFTIGVGADEVDAFRRKYPQVAPERVSGSPCSCKTDIYSLGRVFRKLNNAFRLGIGEMADKCMRQDPDDRPSAAELTDLLRAMSDEHG